MVKRNCTLNPENVFLPSFSQYSFLCGIINIPSFSLKECFHYLIQLHSLFPLSFSCFMGKRNQILFVVYDLTVNFTLIERCGKQLVKENFRTGILHHGLNGLVSSFLEACQAVYTDELVRECHSFEEISSPIGQVLKGQKIVEIERSIRTDLQFHEGNNVIRYIHQWFQETEKMNYTLENIIYDSLNLYSSIKYTLFDMYELKPKRIKAGREVLEIMNIKSKENLEQWFCTWFLYTIDNFDLAHTNPKFQIQNVFRFIDTHITDDLSLNTVANYFYINASYFSALFHREAGQTYISYVTDLKMKKALELLQQNFKVYETAHMLGYEDIHHFRNLFKKHFGISPSQARKNK